MQQILGPTQAGHALKAASRRRRLGNPPVLVVFVLASGAALFRSAVVAAEKSDEFEALMARARGYDPDFSLGCPEVNRNRAVETGCRAIESRGDCTAPSDIEAQTQTPLTARRTLSSGRRYQKEKNQ